MIVSVNPTPRAQEFQDLMARTDRLLNADAMKRPKYYASRGGSPLEDDVASALVESAKGTPFENSIEKVSGQRFPDIIAAKFYGVEVKSTTANHWTSTGSSILESTRIDGIERIYMTFGKLGDPIEFISKPYERCLSGIAVTHMPRYLIDMNLSQGETIFDKMGVPYEELRKMKNPVAPVVRYYKGQLKPGESLWWTGDPAEEVVQPTIRLWNKLSSAEKQKYTIYGCVNFPEVFAGNYDRYALWLTSQGIVDPHIRDQFSAGGQEEMMLPSGLKAKFPGVYRRIKNYRGILQRRLSQIDTVVLDGEPFYIGDELKDRIYQWSVQVSHHSPVGYDLSMDALCTLFGIINDESIPAL